MRSLHLFFVIFFSGILQANAAVIFADTVIDFYDSGAGPIKGPYGGDETASSPISVPAYYAADGNEKTFVSLPKGSYITLGFSSGFVFDGPGLDIYIMELGVANEKADIFISSDFGKTFTFLGMATDATVSGFDLAAIGYTDMVNAIKIVGRDNFGSFPGFDFAYVKGMDGSVILETPEPAMLMLIGLGLIGFCWNTRRSKRS